jgi:hypothetical protein
MNEPELQKQMIEQLKTVSKEDIDIWDSIEEREKLEEQEKERIKKAKEIQQRNIAKKKAKRKTVKESRKKNRRK